MLYKGQNILTQSHHSEMSKNSTKRGNMGAKYLSSFIEKKKSHEPDDFNEEVIEDEWDFEQVVSVPQKAFSE